MVTPKTTAELTQWFEDNFDCMDGPPRAFFTMPNSATTSYRFTYSLYGVAIKAGMHPEEELVKAMHSAFLPVSLLSIEKALFWRRKPALDQTVETVFGKTYALCEEVRDGRVVPIDAVEDFETGTWRQNCGTELLTRLTMRLVIPALIWYPQQIAFERRENELITLLRNLP